MTLLRIDGAQGEGGGQVLRTSLTLSAITGKPVRVENIRAGRKKPGLLRQHLTAVRAVADVCGGEVEGAEVGSSAVTFRPGPPRSGRYRFAVGTAGSACLVCQTVLPVLMGAQGESALQFEGGTHNPQAPPYDFLKYVYFPLLRRMGATVRAELQRPGFYPAGGGAFHVALTAPETPAPIELMERDRSTRIEAWALSSRLPKHIVTREIAVVRAELNLPKRFCRLRPVDSPGPGNVVCILIDSNTPELVVAFGAVGRPAEEVAQDAVAQTRRYLEANVPVGEHLADQLVLLLALAGGRFRTRTLSSHASTNIGVVRAFLGDEAVKVEEDRARSDATVACSRNQMRAQL